ncbi:MAG: OsmC family protein [Bacteroidales bacterium]|nr:OsmC family protein [Bacteroidales bacterium]MDY0086797.1 OsmC family protein [Bacteroidales bacterium]
MTSKIHYTGDLRTEMTHLQSGTKVLTDAPVDNQGRGEVFSPTDLVATALGSCMLTIMGIAAREHGFMIDGTQAEVTKIMAANPRRISEVHIRLLFPEHHYTDKQKKILTKISQSCPVALSLHPDLKQKIELIFID